MPVGVDVAVDAGPQLTAVDDSPSDFGILLLDCVCRTAINVEWEVSFLEWTNQGTVLKFLVDVLLDVLFKQRRALEIPAGVLRVGNCSEGHVPTETKALRDARNIKIVLEKTFPDINREGRMLKWFTKAIHVGSEPGFLQTSRDALNTAVFD